MIRRCAAFAVLFVTVATHAEPLPPLTFNATPGPVIKEYAALMGTAVNQTEALRQLSGSDLEALYETRYHPTGQGRSNLSAIPMLAKESAKLLAKIDQAGRIERDQAIVLWITSAAMIDFTQILFREVTHLGKTNSSYEPLRGLLRNFWDRIIALTPDLTEQLNTAYYEAHEKDFVALKNRNRSSRKRGGVEIMREELFTVSVSSDGWRRPPSDVGLALPLIEALEITADENVLFMALMRLLQLSEIGLDIELPEEQGRRLQAQVEKIGAAKPSPRIRNISRLLEIALDKRAADRAKEASCNADLGETSGAAAGH